MKNNRFRRPEETYLLWRPEGPDEPPPHAGGESGFILVARDALGKWTWKHVAGNGKRPGGPDKSPPQTGSGWQGTERFETFELPFPCRSGGFVLVTRDERSDWRWKHVAGNGLAISGSLEGYKKKAHAISQAWEHAARYGVSLYLYDWREGIRS